MSSNNIGSIHATTISSEKYIVIASQNIELSGNVIMKDNVTISNGTLNCDSLIPNVNNSTSLGTTGSSWSNAYFHDLSVNNNLQVLGNVKIGGNLDVSNIYTKNYIDNSFANVYTRSQITASFENVYTLRQIDLSFQNVNISGEIDLSFANVYTRTHVDLSFQNVHTIREIDLSFQNVYIRRAIDLSFANVNISGQIDQSFANVHTRGYIDTSFQNIYIRRAIDLSFANVNISGQIDISFANVHTRGYVDTSFQNVYTIKQIDTSFANVYTRGVIDTSFRTLYTRLQVDNSFANVHTRKAIDLSYDNIYIRRAIDLSFANVNISGQIDQSFANVYTRGYIDTSFRNIYIRSVIDQSFANVYTRSQADLSFVSKRAFELSYNALAAIGGSGGGSTIVLSSISGNIIPSLNNTYSLGSTTKFWNNSYINNLRLSNRAYQNINSGPFYEINTTVQTWEWHRINAIGLGKSLATILSAEQNEKVKNLLSSRTIGRAFIGGVKKTNATTGQTSADWEWVNGDIWSYTNFMPAQPDQSVERGLEYYTVSPGTGPYQWNDVNKDTFNSVAVYMSYPEDISWSAVNGYYGLAKDAYPSLNPLSSGVKAVQTWIGVSGDTTSNWLHVCWSPELGIFVAVAYAGTNRVMTSSNGITWTVRSLPATEATNTMRAVCWSKELGMFVSVSQDGTNRVITSLDGITWIGRPVINNSWLFVCWSSELGIFVAVGDGGTRVMTSSNGISWSSTNISGVPANSWWGVCWSKELRIFVAVANSGTNRVMTSPNGINWTSMPAAEDLNWRNICWSGELGLFVAIAYATNRIMISQNGTNWIGITVPESNGWLGLCWSSELKLFIAVAQYGNNRVMTSHNGINWIQRFAPSSSFLGVCWSPELGIAVAVAESGANRVITSSLRGCPPTSTNVFDASANASATNSQVVGGTVTSSGGFTIHRFTTTGSSIFVPSFTGTVQVLLVGGGGGGGLGNGGGGGGGGGVIMMPSVSVNAGQQYNIFVGAGGLINTNGGNTTAFEAIAAGGGAGGNFGNNLDGSNGGCGGGASNDEVPPLRTAGIGTGNSLGPNSGTSYSTNGGSCTTVSPGNGGNGAMLGAGGGGAGGAGPATVSTSFTTTEGGNGSGGIGIQSAILGTNYYWAGGGGGGAYAGQGGWGGLGGGGGGNSHASSGGPGGGSALNSGGGSGGNGGENTGGGGGGSSWRPGRPGLGGSGIVVIRYTQGPTPITSISTSFISNSNSISETGTWSFANVATTGTLTVNTTPYNSDDRLKHNESVIVNGLEVIDKLCPKFYQKTQTLLDASYNGDLSGQTWIYEAGLIAQEVLQVPELSFAVGGGDYYYVNHILRSKLNPPSYPPIYYEQKWNYDLSFAISYYQQKMNTDMSFDVSYNTLQIFSDLIMDPSYNILKMNNDLIFDACYNEQKIISDLSNNDLSNSDLSNSDLSYSYYYELSNNVIAQPYTLNYNSIFVYGLAAIKELHAKVKTQESSLLSQQTIINTLTTRMEALETDPNNS